MYLQNNFAIDRQFAMMRKRLILCVAALGMGSLTAYAQNAVQTVDRIKIAYVYNFAKFVDLPHPSENHQDKALRVCVSGRDELSAGMAALNRRMAQGREIVVRKDPSFEQLKDCAIVFVSESDARFLPAVARQMNGASFLLVSDARHALDQGAHLALMHQDDRVDFDVNLQSLQRSNLKASSQMLKLARVVLR